MTVTADPTECSFQFNPAGTAKFTTSATSPSRRWSRRSVNYENVAAPAGTKASVKIGDQIIQAGTAGLRQALGDAITKHGYPAERQSGGDQLRR